MGKSNISWTESTWNPYTWNCNKISPGCQHCYMFEMSRHLKALDAAGAPRWRDSALKELPKLAPGPVFVNSMSDTYHEGAALPWIHRIHNIARQHPHLTMLLLTKRIERAAALAPYLDWPGNLWIGTTVESQDYLWRLDYLRQIKRAAGRFVSFEPLLEAVSPILTGVNWVIVGGESGLKRREFDKDWAWIIQLNARANHIPFFFKQGSDRYPGYDRLLHDREWNEVPTAFHWTPVTHHSDIQLTMF
jgi:protein gp37